jgi:hypothetical protein
MPKALVARPHGQDYGTGRDLRSVRENHDSGAAVCAQIGGPAQHGGFRSERPGLVEGPAAQLGPADSEREPQVVADE